MHTAPGSAGCPGSCSQPAAGPLVQGCMQPQLPPCGTRTLPSSGRCTVGLEAINVVKGAAAPSEQGGLCLQRHSCARGSAAVVVAAVLPAHFSGNEVGARQGAPEVPVVNYTWGNVVQDLGGVPGGVPSRLRMAIASASGCTGRAGVHIPLLRAGGTMI